MKHYRDIFGIPLSKEDVTHAVICTVRTSNPYPSNLQRQMKIGFGKAARLAKLLADAGVASLIDNKNRVVLLKEDAAINAALRQLKKGRK